MSKGSHKIVTAACEFRISPKCTKSREGEHRDFEAIRARNGGKYICMYCSRRLKASGRRNPNARYTIDDSMLKSIDTEAKAYFLGWIGSDGGFGHGGSIVISIHEKDADVLHKLKTELRIDVPIARTKEHMVSLTLCSTEMMGDAAKHLGVPIDRSSLRKDRIVQMPKLATSELQWAFIRGYFDGDGSISQPSDTQRSPAINIASQSDQMRESIRDFCGIPCRVTRDQICWAGNNALEFLDKLYGHSPSLYLERKKDLYLKWCTWVPSLLKGADIRGGSNGFRWAKTAHDAIEPSKQRVTDSGYDLTIIGILKQIGDVTFYRTGIKIQPPFGYYFDLVARSSISKTGYMMAHSIGIIDRSYVGEIIIPLYKVDKAAPDLELPCRIAQLIPRQIVHFDMHVVESFDTTTRGDGGFGSTNLNT